jgi:ATP-dependent DNA ligase
VKTAKLLALASDRTKAGEVARELYRRIEDAKSAAEDRVKDEAMKYALKSAIDMMRDAADSLEQNDPDERRSYMVCLRGNAERAEALLDLLGNPFKPPAASESPTPIQQD